MSDDFLIVGGGAIGLSLAWELSLQGHRARVLDRQQPAQEASWAGAGILPPARRLPGQHPYDQLAGLCRELHPLWAERLFALTGIDTEYRLCGGAYLARTVGESASLRGLQGMWEEQGLDLRKVDLDELARLEPALRELHQRVEVQSAYWAPQEARLRNPRYLQALLAACRGAGVEIEAGVEVRGWSIRDDRVLELSTDQGPRHAAAYCVTAGAWSGPLLRRQNLANGILPMRGQMILFGPGSTSLRCIVNEGPRYLTPRDDGRLLVGSTEEEVGFDKSTTPIAIEDLTNFAEGLLPELRGRPIERSWAGLRPASFDGLPYLGALPAARNLFVAAGHFRSGLFLSPGTARVMGQLMCGQETEIDLTPFRPSRG